MVKIKYAALVVTILTLVGCGKLNLYNISGKDRIVATVYGNNLYASDMSTLFSTDMTSADSIEIAKAYISQWVSGRLKLNAAERQLKDNQKDIDKMVEEYRSSLLSYRYENDYVEKNMDTTITSAQISAYYSDNRDNFRLAGPVVKARVVRIPLDIRGGGKMEELFRSRDDQDIAAFVNICDKNGYRYNNFTDTWTDFNEVLTHLPFTLKDFDDFLKNKSYYESQDDNYKYMMVVDSYLLTGDLSPESREKISIAKVLLYKRRAELLKTLDDSLYNVAQKDRKIEFAK